MDRQETKSMLDAWRARWNRNVPQAVLVYGRRTVPAPGFSVAELREAGVDADRARQLGLPVDASRMTSLGCNVQTLEEFRRR